MFVTGSIPWLLVYCWWLSILVFSASKDTWRCLNLTDAAPKKYIHYMDEPTPIVVQTSTRPLHMLNTEIFKIYLEEIVGFSRVDIVYHDEFKLEDVLKSISSMDLPESKT
jgi:hypothetical protein